MLASCAAYQDGHKLADLSLADIAQYLQKPHAFVWVELHDTTAAELGQLQQTFDLHPLAVEDALTGHQRPKI
jgi:magnesium transporter